MEPKLKPHQQFVKDCLQDNPKKIVMNMSRQIGKSNLHHISRLLKDVFHQRMDRLLVDTGTVFGEEYYSVAPVGGDWLSMISWCYKTYGSDSDPLKEAGGRWYQENRKLWFREQKDRDWFVLRWNS
jgi:hypothetical protein